MIQPDGRKFKAQLLYLSSLKDGDRETKYKVKVFHASIQSRIDSSEAVKG